MANHHAQRLAPLRQRLPFLAPFLPTGEAGGAQLWLSEPDQGAKTVVRNQECSVDVRACEQLSLLLCSCQAKTVHDLDLGSAQTGI